MLPKFSVERENEIYTRGAIDCLNWENPSDSVLRQKIASHLDRIKIESQFNSLQRIYEERWRVMNRFMLFLFFNASGIITFISDGLANSLEVQPKDVLGLSIAEFAKRHSGNHSELHKFLAEQLADSKLKIDPLEFSCNIKDDSEFGSQNWFTVHLVPRFGEFNRWLGYGMFYQNINDTVRLKLLSEQDQLTGISNRKRIDDVINTEIHRSSRTGNPFSLILFDIDFFKQINDDYGHLIGDQALIELTQLIKSHQRSTDTFGRWGGEEFLVICPETSESGAIALATSYLELINHHHFEHIHQLQCSFGVTQYSPKQTKDKLIEQADKALYLAKNLGRNQVKPYRETQSTDA